MILRTNAYFSLAFIFVAAHSLGFVFAQSAEIGDKPINSENRAMVSALMKVGQIIDAVDDPVSQGSRRRKLLAELKPLLAYLQQGPESTKVQQIRYLQRQLIFHERELKIFYLGTYDTGGKDLYVKTRDRMILSIFELKTELFKLKKSLGEKKRYQQEELETELRSRIRKLVGHFEDDLIQEAPQKVIREIYLKELIPLATYLHSSSTTHDKLWRALLKKRLARKMAIHKALSSKSNIDARRRDEIEKLKNQIKKN